MSDSWVDEVRNASAASARIRPAKLLNGWQAAALSHAKPSYTRRADGTVRLAGIIRCGQVGAAAFELPLDCRPGEPMKFDAVPHRAQFGSITVTAEGAVVPSTAGASLPLSNVSFQAAASAGSQAPTAG